MKHLTNWTKWAGVGAIAAVTMAGCTPQQEAEVDEAVDTTAQVTENAVDTTGAAIDNATDTTGNVADGGLVNAADLVTITPQIKENLGDLAGLEGSSINVENDVANNAVHLKGTVVSDAQKQLAEDAAKKELARLDPAGKYKVVNDLVVGAAAP